jgi:DNA-binding CsgD family transcriptional regulator
MANKDNDEDSRFANRVKYEEFYQLHFTDSNHGVWLAKLDEPMPIDLPIDQQVEHMLKHAFLADCNLAFVKMYDYDDPTKLIGARFPQLFDNSEISNLNNLRSFLENKFNVGNTETIEIARNGQRKYFLNEVVGIVENGCLIRVWGMQCDITGEKDKKTSDKKMIQQLTSQEIEILKHTVEGKSLKEIGNAIGVNPKTVDSLRNRIKSKLGVKSLSQLMFLAFQLGFPNMEV